VPDVERFDVLVLGGGEAGKYLAWEMAKSGHATAVVERGLIGGSSPNIACLPSKNVIRSSKVAELNHRAFCSEIDDLGPAGLSNDGLPRPRRG